MADSTDRAHWSGRFAFVLAAAGSAVGLGNIWKFPYMAGVNGGGAFVFVYLMCIAIVGMPILIAEIYIGRSSQKNAVQAFEELHREKTPWRLAGILGIVSAFLILSFYSVVGGWVLDFEFKSILNQFASQDDAVVKEFLGSLFASPLRLIFWHTLFMGATVYIVIGGISKGIEKWSRLLMPLLILLLGILFVRAMFLDGFGEAMTFLFSPDFSKLSWSGVLEAVGHSFFTLSLGMGAMITYGSYMKKSENVIFTAFAVGILDTLVAIVAGIVIFAVVFSYGQEPGAGPTLMFVTLPLLFKQMAGGYFVSIMFFLLVAFAALTSAISLLEVVVTYWDEEHNWPRKKTTLVMGGTIWALGILCALSFNVLSDFKFFGKFNTFDLFDVATSKIFLPLGGMVIALYYGWVLGPKAVIATFESPPKKAISMSLMWTARVVAPAAVLFMLIQGVMDL
jgi:neurotransmitter:Na+ symporter, NSS family